MKFFWMGLVLVSNLVLTGSALHASGGGSASGQGGAHWGYGEQDGPKHWGEMGHPVCREGKNQSPIDLSTHASVTLDPLAFHYQAGALTALNNGHTIQYAVAGNNTLAIGGETYGLKQFHFHGPSEHTRDGRPFPMEVHLVHANEHGNLAVVGVMLAPGNASDPGAQGRDRILGVMPGASGQSLPVEGVFDPRDLLPSGSDYFHYRGSLTTPPCSEGVAWFVMKQPVEIGPERVAAFQALFQNNARPPQPLHERILFSLEGGGGH